MFELRLFHMYANVDGYYNSGSTSSFTDMFWSALLTQRQLPDRMLAWKYVNFLLKNGIHFIIDAEMKYETYIFARNMRDAGRSWAKGMHYESRDMAFYKLIIPNKRDAMFFKLVML